MQKIFSRKNCFLTRERETERGKERKGKWQREREGDKWVTRVIDSSKESLVHYEEVPYTSCSKPMN